MLCSTCRRNDQIRFHLKKGFWRQSAFLQYLIANSKHRRPHARWRHLFADKTRGSCLYRNAPSSPEAYAWGSLCLPGFVRRISAIREASGPYASRTYRQKARQAYRSVAKQKKPGYKKIRKTIGQQLRYLKRNLGSIDRMVADGLFEFLDKRLYRLFLVTQELYRQQYWMYANRTHKVSDRLVSLYQPHVRPMVSGKAKNPVEFGAKVSTSLVDGFSFVEKIGWVIILLRCMWIGFTGHVRIIGIAKRRASGYQIHRWVSPFRRRPYEKNNRGSNVRTGLTGLRLKASSARENVGSAWPG